MSRAHRGGAAFAAAILVTFAGFANAQDVPLDDRFKYQGELRNAGVVVDGVVDLQLSIFDQSTLGNQVGATQTVLGVQVSRGVFEVDVPFSALAFAGQTRHLQIAVRSPAGAGVYTTLNPRIELLPAPNAHYARVAGSALNLGGVSLGGLVQKAEAGSITLGMLAIGAVNSATILDGSITGADLAANTITAANIAAGTITGTEIASNTINSGDIQNGAVNNVDLAADAVDSSKILDGSVTAADLAVGAIDGGNATTIDGIDSSQFFRTDVSETITAPLFTIQTGFTPNAYTIGGPNLDLRLGDTNLDTVTTSGTFTVLGNTILGNAPRDNTTVSGALLVNSGDLTVSNQIGNGDIIAANTLRLAAPFVSTSANVILEGSGVGGSGFLIFGDGNAEKRIQLNGIDPVLTIDGAIGQSATVVIPDKLVAGAFEAGGGILDNQLVLGTAEGDSNLYFYDQGSQTANRIRWVDSAAVACGPFGQFDSYFNWRITDSTNTGWILGDGSDFEVFIDETGNVVIDGALTQSSGCDLAEMFFSTARLEPGTVVAIDPAAPEYVVASSRASQYGLVGVVSSNPGVILNGPPAEALPFVQERNEVELALSANPGSPELEQRFLDLERMLDTWPRGDVAVALTGRVPVKVIGNVEAGDPLTSSDVAGHAMAVTLPGPAIGIALESKTGAGTGSVLMLVQPGYHAPRNFGGFGTVARESVDSSSNELNSDLLARVASLEEQLSKATMGRDTKEARSLADEESGSTTASPPQGRTGGTDRENGRGDRLDDSPAAIVQIRKEAWGDFDADGKDDVFVVVPGGASKLYRNLGDGSFQDITATSELDVSANLRIALWRDFDVDNALDLLLVDSAGVARLYQGLGHGRFQDVTTSLGLDFGQPIVDAEWLDHDRDGKPDLKVSIADGRLLLHHNLGGGAFRTSELRSAITLQSGNGERMASLEAENAAIRAQLDELKALISTLATDAGVKR